MPYNGLTAYRNPFEWTPQSEAWVEAAGWIAEKKRARLRDDPTEEAFARLAFQLCKQQTQETERCRRAGLGRQERSLSQWIGGIGILVLFVAIAPQACVRLDI